MSTDVLHRSIFMFRTGLNDMHITWLPCSNPVRLQKFNFGYRRLGSMPKTVRVMHCSASFLHLPFDADSSRIAVSSQGADYR